MKNKEKKLEEFLYKVDTSFPVPLSEKQDLKEFSRKLIKYATLCTIEENDKIVSLVAGYTENVIQNMGYISIVATLDEAQGKGFAKKLVKQFIEMSREKQLDAVHLYAVASNEKAVRMYSSMGFVEYKVENEHRSEDLHLIYYIDRQEL